MARPQRRNTKEDPAKPIPREKAPYKQYVYIEATEHMFERVAEAPNMVNTSVIITSLMQQGFDVKVGYVEIEVEGKLEMECRASASRVYCDDAAELGLMTGAVADCYEYALEMLWLKLEAVQFRLASNVARPDRRRFR